MVKVELLFSGGRVEKAWIPDEYAVLKKQISVVDEAEKVWTCKIIDIFPSVKFLLTEDTSYYPEIIPF